MDAVLQLIFKSIWSPLRHIFFWTQKLGFKGLHYRMDHLIHVIEFLNCRIRWLRQNTVTLSHLKKLNCRSKISHQKKHQNFDIIQNNNLPTEFEQTKVGGTLKSRKAANSPNSYRLHHIIVSNIQTTWKSHLQQNQSENVRYSTDHTGSFQTEQSCTDQILSFTTYIEVIF